MAASVLYLQAASAYDLTGLADGSDGRLMVVCNVGAHTITLKKESSFSGAQNRFAFASDLPLGPQQACLLIYSITARRWRAVGTADEGWSPVPASPASSGIAGQKAYSDAWLYICVATNTWRRTALATWTDGEALMDQTGADLLTQASEPIRTQG